MSKKHKEQIKKLIFSLNLYDEAMGYCNDDSLDKDIKKISKALDKFQQATIGEVVEFRNKFERESNTSKPFQSGVVEILDRLLDKLKKEG